MPSLFDEVMGQQQGAPQPPAATPAASMTPAPVAAPQTSIFDEYMQQQSSPGSGGGGYQPAAVNTPVTPNAEPQWSDLPGNILPSAGENISGLAQTVMHPIDTGEAIYNLGPSGIKDYFVNRYGSYENLKKSVITDPVGVLLDISTVLSGGGTAAAKIGVAGGRLAKAGEIAAKAGRYTDPLLGAAKVTGKLASGGAKIAAVGLGSTTGAGSGVRQAAEAGFKGGEAAKAFKSNIGGGDPELVVEHAKQAVGHGFNALTKGYGDELSTIQHIAVPVAPATTAIRNKMADILTKYKGAPPAPGLKALPRERFDPIIGTMTKKVNSFLRTIGKDSRYSTIGEFDNLRQDLKTIRDKFDIGSAKYKLANEYYDSIKDTIAGVHPEYKALVNDYAKQRNFLKDIVKTLSLGPGSTADSAIRKLQSTTRDWTAHANMGARLKLINALVANGAHNLVYELAGQSMKPHFKANIGGNLAGAAAFGGLTGYLTPWTIGILAAFSPRLIGRAAYTSGRVGSLITKPALNVERAFKRIGIATGSRAPIKAAQAISAGRGAVKQVAQKTGVSMRGAGLAAVQLSRAANFNDDGPKLRSALDKQARSMGYNIDGRVLDALTAKLMSDDPETYVKGLNQLGHNERLMNLIKALGEQKVNE